MKKLISMIASLLALSAAQGVEYNKVLIEKSAIAFVYKQMNVPMEGSFKHFSGQLSFDPEKPAAAKARFEIDVASIDTGATDADEEVKGKLWFNTKTFPQAQFTSTSIKAAGPNRFDVVGTLTIKGKSANVNTFVTLRREADYAIFDGTLTIKRADFGIGEGIWADFGTVANDVQIKFRLQAASVVVKK